MKVYVRSIRLECQNKYFLVWTSSSVNKHDLIFTEEIKAIFEYGIATTYPIEWLLLCNHGRKNQKSRNISKAFLNLYRLSGVAIDYKNKINRTINHKPLNQTCFASTSYKVFILRNLNSLMRANFNDQTNNKMALFRELGLRELKIWHMYPVETAK